MKSPNVRWVQSFFALALLPGVGAPALTAAQLPESFTNLQVLPEDISRQELVGFMRNFSFATGLRCSGCHMGEEGQPFSEYDFASDDRSTKVKARSMLRMTGAINNEYLASLEDRGEPAVRVTCTTCHGGISRPEPIGSLVARVMEADGADAAIEQYRALRRDYHGTRAYDFGEQPLIEAGQATAGAGSIEGGAALLELNAEFFPESGQTYTVLGEVHRAGGNNEAALAAYRRALEIDPENQVAQRRIAELGGS